MTSNYVQTLLTDLSAGRKNKSSAVCSKAGINVLSKEQIKLDSLRDLLKYQVEELKSSLDWHDFRANGLIIAQILKASCDAFISMSAAAADALLPAGVGKQAKAVAESYSVAQSYVTLRMDNGNIPKDIKAANTILKSQTKKVPGVKYTHMASDILTDAFAQDTAAVKKDVIGFVQTAHRDAGNLAVLSSRHAGYLSKEGARRVSGVLKLADLATSVTTATQSYSLALEKAFDEKLENDDFKRGREQQIGKLLAQIAIIDAKIAAIIKALLECGQYPEEPLFTPALAQTARR